MINKDELRGKMRTIISALPREYNISASQAIVQKLLAHPAYKAAKTVFCFVGTESEIDTMPFLNKVIADGKTLCVPYCESLGIMTAKQITSTAQLKEGRYGIKAPDKSVTNIAPECIDFAVIPCLAANKSGARLGYGGGFYDRYIPLMTNGKSVCVCRKKCLCDEIPLRPHDIIVDIITE